MFLFLVFMLGFIHILQFLSWLYLGFLASLLARSKVTVKTFYVTKDWFHINAVLLLTILQRILNQYHRFD